MAEAGKPRTPRQQSAAVNWDLGHGGNGSWELQGSAGREECEVSF